MSEQYIACPNCKNNILFDVNALLSGASFACSKCNAKIKLANESKETVSKSIEEFNSIKTNALKQQSHDKI